MKIKTAGLDLAKTAIQMHGAAERGKAMLKRQLEREQVLTFGRVAQRNRTPTPSENRT